MAITAFFPRPGGILGRERQSGGACLRGRSSWPEFAIACLQPPACSPRRFRPQRRPSSRRRRNGAPPAWWTRSRCAARRSPTRRASPRAWRPKWTGSAHAAGRNSPSSDRERDDFSSNRHSALAYCWSMIFSENRYPLFGIMLSRGRGPAKRAAARSRVLEQALEESVLCRLGFLVRPPFGFRMQPLALQLDEHLGVTQREIAADVVAHRGVPDEAQHAQERGLVVLELGIARFQEIERQAPPALIGRTEHLV